jgi:hypothetical protein
MAGAEGEPVNVKVNMTIRIMSELAARWRYGINLEGAVGGYNRTNHEQWIGGQLVNATIVLANVRMRAHACVCVCVCVFGWVVGGPTSVNMNVSDPTSVPQ